MKKIAYIFPGQGAQKAGMGQDFYEQFIVSKQIYDQASKLLDLDMKALCFADNELLDRTEYTQAALVTTELAIHAALREQFRGADVTAGLSLGEYSALVAAEAMQIEDAICVVRQRGILMEHEVPAGLGAMAAVLGLSGEVIQETLIPIEGVEIANYNCPGQIVISGKKEAVEHAAEVLKDAGARRVIMLNVSGPFHSSMLCGAGEKLAKVLSEVTFSEPTIPYATNVTGEYVRNKERIPGCLETQVSASVKWQQCIETMINDGVEVFVEIGPQKTLSGFMKKINKDVKSYSIGTVEEMKQVVEVLKQLDHE